MQIFKSGEGLAEIKHMILPMFTKNDHKNGYAEPNQSST